MGKGHCANRWQTDTTDRTQEVPVDASLGTSRRYHAIPSPVLPARTPRMPSERLGRALLRGTGEVAG